MDKILIAPATLAGVEGLYLQTLKEAGFELVFPPNAGHWSEDDLLGLLNGVKASIAGSEPYTRRVFEAHPQLRVVARSGVGYDAVDVEAATEHGIAVTTTPGTNQESVAEHTVALILALARHVVTQHNTTCAGDWVRQIIRQPLRQRTLGLAGLGRIGKAVAIRGLAFQMRVIAYEPFPDKEFVARYKIPLVSFDELLAQSDYLSLHVPLTQESRHLINHETLGKMKTTAFFINTSRGGLVREADLIEALQTRRIAGAALDVFEQEPPPKDHPFLSMDNVVVTPHGAGVDLQSRDDMAVASARAIVALSRGEWPDAQVVNKEVRSKFQW